LQAAKLSQDELITRIDAEEVRTLVSVDYNPNKHRHIAYKPQDVMNWVLQPWYKQMLSMNHLLVSCYSNDSQLNLARYSTSSTGHVMICIPSKGGAPPLLQDLRCMPLCAAGDTSAQVGHALDCG